MKKLPSITDKTHKIRDLREVMAARELVGYLQPVQDEYMSEYPPACNRRVEWLCGFSGSAGSVAVLADKAAIFVDGRYTLQAENEVDHALFERHNSASITPEAWLAAHVKAGARIGYDPKIYSRDAVRRMHAALDKKNIEITPVDNLIDALWVDRPAPPASMVFVHEKIHAGENSSDKRRRIAKKVKEEGADLLMQAAPEAINWLLNVRGRDITNTPLALGVATLDTHGKMRWYMSASRCDEAVRSHLGSQVELREPEMLEEDLTGIAKAGKRVLCDPSVLPAWFMQLLAHEGAQIVEARDPCPLAKAIKNPVELQGIRNAHIRDGVAVAKLLAWLEREAPMRMVTELEVAEKLLSLRAENPLFVEPSFTTIAGSGPHGAIVHYRATPESDRTLRKGELFLLDSGGQYPDGTTDITRTVAIGLPTAEHKDRFTRVLKGHIALALAVFPEGTSGSQLDALARQFLWQAGLDYDHGTGHGVGCFLGVHEGPQRISKRGGDAALQAGMIVSNEPGYYKTGAYGIRIENLVAVVKKGEAENGKTLLGFDTLTCVPLDRRLVATALLTTEEKQWLSGYHAWVMRTLSPMLDDKECAWLEKNCLPL